MFKNNFGAYTNFFIFHQGGGDAGSVFVGLAESLEDVVLFRVMVILWVIRGSNLDSSCKC